MKSGDLVKHFIYYDDYIVKDTAYGIIIKTWKEAQCVEVLNCDGEIKQVWIKEIEVVDENW